MALMNRNKQAERAGADAQPAWDNGLSAYVMKVQALTSVNDEMLSLAVSKVIDIGWKLHSTAFVYNQTGMNTVEGYFTFIRP
ncbi:MAG TPA: hypothetical protein VIW26_03495 [Gemmatimonadales bacterium]|jgi:hypothetical protein